MRTVKMICCFLCCALLFLMSSFWSYAEETTSAVAQEQKPKGDFCVPEEISHIKMYDYADSVEMTSLTIPDSVIYIDMWAFQRCTSLKTVFFPKQLPSTRLSGGWAGSGFWSPYTFGDVFLGCTALETLVASPEAEGYRVENNCLITDEGKLLFATKNAVIPDDGSIKNIGADAFAGLKTIKSITIPNGVETIEARAFAGTGIEQLVLPESVKHINESAFFCNDLQELIFGKNVEVIETSNERGWYKGFYAREYVPNLTIKCYKGTVAYQYAMDNYIPVVLLDDSLAEQTSAIIPETQDASLSEIATEPIQTTAETIIEKPETVYEESETKTEPETEIMVGEVTEETQFSITGSLGESVSAEERTESFAINSAEKTGEGSQIAGVTDKDKEEKTDLVTLLAGILIGAFAVVALSIVVPLIVRSFFGNTKNKKAD